MGEARGSRKDPPAEMRQAPACRASAGGGVGAVPLVAPVPVTSAPPMVYRGIAGTEQAQAKYLLKK